MIATSKIIYQFSDFIKDNKQLVIAVGYTTTGNFGYFLCWENNGRLENILFKKKENEHTYQDILIEAKKIIKSCKK